MLVQNRSLAHTHTHTNIRSADIHSIYCPTDMQNSQWHTLENVKSVHVQINTLAWTFCLVIKLTYIHFILSYIVSTTWFHEPQSQFSPPSFFLSLSLFLSRSFYVPPSPLSAEFHVSSHQICTHTEQVRIWLLSLLLKLDGFSIHLLHTCILS